jgi:hypothetical protein
MNKEVKQDELVAWRYKPKTNGGWVRPEFAIESAHGIKE